jgi:hypothetical protein
LLILLSVNLILLRPLLQLLWSDPILLIPLLGLLLPKSVPWLWRWLIYIAAPFGVGRNKKEPENKNYGYSIRHAILLCTVSPFNPSTSVGVAVMCHAGTKNKNEIVTISFRGPAVCPSVPAARPTAGAFFRAGTMPPFQNFRCSDTAAVLKTSRSHTQKSPTIGKIRNYLRSDLGTLSLYADSLLLITKVWSPRQQARAADFRDP